MNGSRAKQIRREVYGDHAFHGENRGYIGRFVDKIVQIAAGEAKKVRRVTVETGPESLRRKYQMAKRSYKLAMRGGM